MSSDIIDWTAPSLQGKFPKLPEELPHGFIQPPEKVLELLERERLKHRPEVFDRAYERLLNEWTLQYYFDYLGYEVKYRLTPEGPEVIAVGFEEMLALRRRIGEEEFCKLKTYMT